MITEMVVKGDGDGAFDMVIVIVTNVVVVVVTTATMNASVTGCR